MRGEYSSKRMQERIALPLQIRVDCRESTTHQWVQFTRLLDITQHGAGFTLRRPTEPGRLLKLTIPMPARLRSFDHAGPQYFVWGMVRHTSIIPGLSHPGFECFRVGVAFVGKQPPPSFEADPATRFQADPPSGDEDSMWRITSERPGGGLQEERRREPRLVIPIDVVIETLDEDGEPGAREHTVTENISSRGAAVLTNLPVEVGRFVRISSERDNVSMFAAVRCRRTGADGIGRLGLEFINEGWPLEGA